MNRDCSPLIEARDCHCRCAALQSRLDRAMIEAERIEQAGKGVVELLVPTLDNPICGDRPRVLVLLAATLEPAELDEDLADHTAAELRRAACNLLAAARSIDRSHSDESEVSA